VREPGEIGAVRGQYPPTGQRLSTSKRRDPALSGSDRGREGTAGDKQWLTKNLDHAHKTPKKGSPEFTIGGGKKNHPAQYFGIVKEKVTWQSSIRKVDDRKGRPTFRAKIRRRQNAGR